MEFTNAQILDFAGNEEIFQKAQTLVKENRIVSLDIDNFSSKDIIMVNATVKDGKNYHEVNMSIDKDDVVVKAHLCNCSHHGKTSLSCEHCTAVLMKLNEEHEKEIKENTPIKVPQYDKDAFSLMNAYEEQIIYSSLAINFHQAIHIEPVLEIRQRKVFALTLKVGQAKQYIVKDIAQFLDDIRHNVKKSYGKELEFLHNRFSFDEESQKLLDFMIRHEHDVLYFLNHSELSKCPQARNLCMTSDALDEFYELYKGQDVMHRMKEKMLINMRFTDENPAFTMEVKKTEDDQYEIGLNTLQYRLFEGRNHLYVLMNHILYRCDE